MNEHLLHISMWDKEVPSKIDTEQNGDSLHGTGSMLYFWNPDQCRCAQNCLHVRIALCLCKQQASETTCESTIVKKVGSLV